jgi:hypothetical protein
LRFANGVDVLAIPLVIAVKIDSRRRAARPWNESPISRSDPPEAPEASPHFADQGC